MSDMTALMLLAGDETAQLTVPGLEVSMMR